ncbi:MAG: hypothetical protein LC620_03710, partial [Halobacteriales archaeon]|nr:hypothetical protein [Halobacteriales archaeon]
FNVDPYMWTDHTTGRTFAGGLNGYNSVFGVSDNNGVTWSNTPSSPASGGGWDHESLATGPYASPAPLAPPPSWPAGGPFLATYYCSQSGAGSMSCSRSDDGGTSWTATGLQANGQCGGLHGHPRISPVDGSVYVPSKSCSGKNGFMMSPDNGSTWNLRTIAASTPDGGFDPAVGISKADGTISPASVGNVLYYAQGDNDGIHVAKSVNANRMDLGTVTLGGGNSGAGITPSGWFDLGKLVTPNVVRAVFPDVEVGDDTRAFVSFLGSTQAFDHDDCNLAQVWNYYVAYTYDGGVTWTMVMANPATDPIQHDGIWSAGTGGACRNLLDFNDMQADGHGRLYIGYGDGCIASDGCTSAGTGGHQPESSGIGGILRQRTGCGLFHRYDEPGVAATCG